MTPADTDRLLRLLEDAVNYVEQAQTIVYEATRNERKGAAILHRMGARVAGRLEVELERLLP